MSLKNSPESIFTKNSSLSPGNAGGFSLIEVVVAFAVFFIVLLGVFTVFTFCVNYNAGNYTRAQALTVLQRETEFLRSAKFTPYSTDSALIGGARPLKTVVSDDGNRYQIQTIVDDDPAMPGVQTDPSKKLKEITITVSLESPTPGWQTAVPAKTILRRVRAN